MSQLNEFTGLADSDPRWAAIVERDASQDGAFVYSVRTTGVYCRPSCPSRRARRENVAFHDSPASAEAAGFRPCKRCRPDLAAGVSPHAALVASLCRLIAEADTPPTLAGLSKRAGLSPFHLQRVFKSVTGLTPAAYARAVRAGALRGALAEAPSVTDAIYRAGYASSGRFYESADRELGMTPTAFRRRGAGCTIHFAIGQCALGAILVAQSERGVCAISLGDDPQALIEALQNDFPDASLVGGDPQFDAKVARVVGFVEAPGIGFDLPLDIRGTAFQRRVWQALRDIPVGETVSYSELAKRIGMPSASRAVASACAANRIAVAIPCHRVVRTDGSLSGYRWGVERKAALLGREATGRESGGNRA
ncbi:bifunctional DNA-binding transcriptional regulator/O6-methylguanine-DNA methyltransferase Ada [Paludibacterium paludis]|uniref:Bifunctional transcriptional activator/DNA repair enzyme protein Ada n=1 Tax=Paludibacterium paludis TaxID=1225769 RepID=A0A918UBI7_9NEIS|nr:bifunctional DNA-binding transcriptional regulator/O6-methylguanine-DNA methyltransferase Ada [Paludibacterium paludis]GGY24235.1 bifunctional transcriptional activator/DNA repair enzyme protein Ada [Paludibacterium paludis]